MAYTFLLGKQIEMYCCINECVVFNKSIFFATSALTAIHARNSAYIFMKFST